MLFLLTFLALALVRIAFTENILVVNPNPSYSHQIAFSHLIKELSLKGHKVTLITMFPLDDPKLTNLTEINVKFVRYKLEKSVNMPSIVQSNDMWGVYMFAWNLCSSVSELILSDNVIRDLIAENRKFDLVIVNVFYAEYLTLGKIYNCPTMLINSYYLEEYFHSAVGNPINAVAHSHMMLPFHKPANFKERVSSVMYMIFRWIFFVYKVLPTKQKLIEKHFNISVSLNDLISDVDMVLATIHPVLQEVRSLGPTTICIGYHRPPISDKPLQKDLKKFMDEATDGFVYFSLGTNIQAHSLNKDTLRTFIEAMRGVPLKFLFKYEGDHLENKPENVQLVNWAPQNEVLKHPNIKLFIMQGGFQSMEEAIYSAVPMVVIPFFVDQFHNAKLIEKKGIGRMVSRNPLTKEDLVAAINEVANDPSYKERVTHLRQLALDVPMTGLEKAIWWIEYVIRNKGAKHLRNPAADVPFYQYFLLDVIGCLIIVILAISVVLYLLIKKMVRVVCQMRAKHKTE